MAPVSADVKQQLVSKYVRTAQGRQILAASMIQPLRMRRDYSAVGRKGLLVEQLPDGALAIYDKDADVTAFVVGEEGENILAIQKPRRVTFPLFEIASNPEIPLTQIKERRFDLIDRSQDLARAQIQAAEDERFFAVLDTVCTAGFDGVPGTLAADIPVLAPISPSVMADGWAQVEKQDLRVAKVYFNALDYADIRKFGRDILDIESQAVLLKTGLQAVMWGAQLMVSRLVPQGYVYICCEAEFLGRLPVRTELTVLSADDPKNRTIGFSVFENLGIGCFNPGGITRLVIER